MDCLTWKTDILSAINLEMKCVNICKYLTNSHLSSCQRNLCAGIILGPILVESTCVTMLRTAFCLILPAAQWDVNDDPYLFDLVYASLLLQIYLLLCNVIITEVGTLACDIKNKDKNIICVQNTCLCHSISCSWLAFYHMLHLIQNEQVKTVKLRTEPKDYPFFTENKSHYIFVHQSISNSVSLDTDCWQVCTWIGLSRMHSIKHKQS